MDTLIEKSIEKVAATGTKFVRGFMHEIDWTPRLVGIRGARGVGKTTLLLQKLKSLPNDDISAVYLSLDNVWFSEHKLYQFVDYFVKRGGKRLFLDEVHKYPNWSQEIKNLYDDFPELHIVFTGSSLLEILNARADLSRRAIVHEMQGLSFREYLNLSRNTDFQVFSLNDILTQQNAISQTVLSKIKPLQHFQDYLQYGYYPFFVEGKQNYHFRLEEVVNMILEIELPLLRNVEVAYIHKVKQLLQIIAESVPFVPNISKLSERIGINRATFLAYLNYLQEAKLTKHLDKNIMGINKLQKPEKIYLENTNLAYTLARHNTNIGNMRETFFLNQLSYKHIVNFPNQGDFYVDQTYHFEIGGKSKTGKQLQGTGNAFIVADDIEYGFDNKLPLWMFGFLY